MGLSWSAVENYVPDKPGTVAVQHCVIGKQKLFITKQRDGTVLAHCKHCNAGGHWKPTIRSPKLIQDLLNNKQHNEQKEFVYPADYTTNLMEWSDTAYAWVRKYDITATEVKHYGLGYSAVYDCVVLPCFAGNVLLGVQYRSLHRKADESKYRTHRIYRDIMWCSFSNDDVNNDSDICFVVEDILSGIKCARVAHSCALLGTNLTDACLNRIKHHKTFIVFLDNDNAQVLRSRNKIATKLRLFGDVTVINLQQDPKELTTEQLRCLIS